MRVLSKKTLREFWLKHEDCENQLLGWYKEVKLSKYQSSEEFLAAFPNGRAIGRSRYIFNIKGNKYRLVVKANFDLKTIWIRFIRTHSEYDAINALEI
ncbi:type II toxin-antitoxin system HigB family toxin [Cryomorpha ignava]|uniref:Type II toxin-antitoxin system HigB family toxin n=1 Tax=Cryomorpha ignava TaxID=101383 RepID=A0A7K3WNL4_9FLAO|nr:type II toxin-antitoxin system HigB family toxin [Cryomorpha ignava]NEN22295.1 type II toxin-antitoxin system HigB family toxin [Cryomorpha ignava]